MYVAVAYLDVYRIRYDLRQRGRCHVGGEDSVMESALALAGLDPIGLAPGSRAHISSSQDPS